MRITTASFALSTYVRPQVDSPNRGICQRPYPTRTVRVQRAACSANPPHTEEVIKGRTLAWARTIVVPLNLCPFAKNVLDENTVRTVVSTADSEVDVCQEIMREIDILVNTSADNLSTTLIVFPSFAADDFLTFLDLFQILEAFIEENEKLVDEVMLANFHPLHRWMDSSNGDHAINYDKRAPYPIVNLLRAPQVDDYVEQGKTQGILEANKNTLERVGLQTMKDLYAALPSVDRNHAG